MKKFPLKMFLLCEAINFLMSLHEPTLSDVFAVFILVQIPTVAVIALIWAAKLGWFNDL